MNTPDFLEYVRSYQRKHGFSNKDMAALLLFERGRNYIRWVEEDSSYDALSRTLAMIEAVGLKVVLDPHHKPSMQPTRL